MRVVPLTPVANQSFTVTLEGVRWVLRILEARGVMAADIFRDGVQLLSASRVLAGEALIPYAYLQSSNFVLIVRDGELPAYSQFGVSQFLVYLSSLEIAELQANPQTINSLDPFTPSYLLDENGFYLTTDTGELLTDD